MPTPVVKLIPTSSMEANIMPKPINFSDLEYERYVTTCPSSFNGLSPTWLKANVIEDQNKLLFFTLDELNQLYFNDMKLNKLSKLRHSLDTIDKDGITMENCSFYITIGMKKAYETQFEKAKPTTKNSQPEAINLKGKSVSQRGSKPNYEEIFVDFFNRMFARSEADQLENSYSKENLLSICIFSRSCHKTKTNLRRFNDELIAAASYIMDDFDSVLLSWLGVVEKSLKDIEVHESFKDDATPLRKGFNIGTFLLIICQVFKSTIQKNWCPIVCQVHENADEGPLNFYKKNFFYRTTERRNYLR